jgi:hypothetical protein
MAAVHASAAAGTSDEVALDVAVCSAALFFVLRVQLNSEERMTMVVKHETRNLMLLTTAAFVPLFYA